MAKKHWFIFVMIIIFIFIYSAAVARAETFKTVNIPIEADIELINFYKKYISQAYKSLGYKINYHQVSPGRGLIEVNEGRFDAVIIRIEIKNDNLNNLIQIPVLLAQGNLILYCQKTIICQQSIFDNSANFIGVVRGATFSAAYMEYQQANSYQMINNTKMAEMFNKGRLEYILSVEDNLHGEIFTLTGNSYQKVLVQKALAYHYIHKKLAHLVPELTIALQEALNN